MAPIGKGSRSGGRIAHTERSAGVHPAAARIAKRMHEIPRVLGLSNVLRLSQPCSAVSQTIWATRPIGEPRRCAAWQDLMQ
jgi:hypothetical protein